MTRKALITWGGREFHTPKQSALVIRDMLAAHDFEVVVENGTTAYGDPELASFDLIIPVITLGTIEKPELQNLLQAVRGGTGLAGFHATMCDTFRMETDYQFMTGGQWVKHPGDIIDYRINIAKPSDPIMRGISDFDYRSEQYYMHVDPSNEVLATTTFTGEYFGWIDGVVMPVVWKRRFGTGRVFYSALGHTFEEFKVPQMHTIMERGLLWAARSPNP
ncbi:ThuA domain-containing protein [Mesorhizobium sp. ORS 3428]|uniref:ThuA domain-containing protein n=1 Tax=Mesorhizobium sp. ORS 3428 TaxID=540997 RepID=UPI000501A872|nr:ThuA domain-containing protein [Mesorhizobium sp. ORS 3428]OHV89858.1 hypothetical protein ORS3428_30175 [Mesorhizobium sp. ORS 3428]CDX33131.1 conserved hypothetical protein [Mesorhizobium sp. SOD10]